MIPISWVLFSATGGIWFVQDPFFNLTRSAHATDPRGRSADDPTDDSKIFRRAGPPKKFSRRRDLFAVKFSASYDAWRPQKRKKIEKRKFPKIFGPGLIIFAILARFLKSYTRFDVKISFPSIFCFRCTYYEPRATENRLIHAKIGPTWLVRGWIRRSLSVVRRSLSDIRPALSVCSIFFGRFAPKKK